MISHTVLWRMRYGVSFVSSNSNVHSATVTTVMYAISYYIGLDYKGTWMCVYYFVLSGPDFLSTYYRKKIDVYAYINAYVSKSFS